MLKTLLSGTGLLTAATRSAADVNGATSTTRRKGTDPLKMAKKSAMAPGGAKTSVLGVLGFLTSTAIVSQINYGAAGLVGQS